MNFARLSIVSFLSFLAVLSFTAGSFGLEDEDVAYDAISNAEQNLESIYATILEAESFGANLSEVLPGLNEVAAFLADAEICYRGGNYSGAIYFAGLASERLNNLRNEVDEFAYSAAVELGQNRSLILGGSIVGGLLVVLIGLLGWGYCREKYIQRVLKMKPEVHEFDKP